MSKLLTVYYSQIVKWRWKNIHRNDFIVELTYHTKIRKESSLWIHLILHHHKKGQHLIKEERYYISIRLNIDHRSVYKIAKELHRPYNTIKQEEQCRAEYLYAGTDFMCDGGATASYYYGPLKPNNW